MKRLLLAGLACGLAIVGIVLWGPRPTPSGQPGLARLEAPGAAAFVAAFDGAADSVRAVVLLSPT